MGRQENRRWSPDEMSELVELREVRNLSWEEIGWHFRVDRNKASSRYHAHKAKLRLEAKQRALGIVVPKPRRGRPPKIQPPLIAPAPPPVEAASPAAPIKRPRIFSDAERFVMDRIERQGLTAGFCGDPLPGRSALDQREAGK